MVARTKKTTSSSKIQKIIENPKFLPQEKENGRGVAVTTSARTKKVRQWQAKKQPRQRQARKAKTTQVMKAPTRIWRSEAHISKAECTKQKSLTITTQVMKAERHVCSPRAYSHSTLAPLEL